MKQRWAIPDIHGECNKLELLLDAIKYQSDTHKLIFLGDYIDRGPNSAGVLVRLMELEKEGARCLLGNHERMMIEAVESADYRKVMLWMMNGGGATNDSYGGNTRLKEAHVQWLKTLPLWYEDEQYFYSHAPLPAGVSELENWEVVKRSEHTLTWSYFLPESDAFTIPGKIGVCGHVHALQRKIVEPRLYPHYLYLDAGCGCWQAAPLIAYNLDEKYYVKHTGERVGP